jgi:hypothetical protein
MMPGRKLFILPALAVLTVAILACNAMTPTAEPSSTAAVIAGPTYSLQKPVLPITEDQVPRVTVEEAMVAISSGAAIFVDVRSRQSYDASHIPGALSIPLGEIETNPTQPVLFKDHWIITYCT